MSHWFAIVCTLTLLPVLLACAPSAAAEEFTPPSNMEELSQWVTTAFPEWDEERVTGFVGELSLALDETSRPLSPAERSDLIAHTPARVMHSLLSRVELVPSSIPSFVETYRYVSTKEGIELGTSSTRESKLCITRAGVCAIRSLRSAGERGLEVSSRARDNSPTKPVTLSSSHSGKAVVTHWESSSMLDGGVNSSAAADGAHASSTGRRVRVQTIANQCDTEFSLI